MQDEHFMRLWLEAHSRSAAPGAVTDVLGSRFDMLRERVGVIGKAHGRHAPSPAPLPGARAQLARLFARAIPAGILAGMAAAALAGAPIFSPPHWATAQADTPRFELPAAA